MEEDDIEKESIDFIIDSIFNTYFNSNSGVRHDQSQSCNNN